MAMLLAHACISAVDAHGADGGTRFYEFKMELAPVGVAARQELNISYDGQRMP